MNQIIEIDLDKLREVNLTPNEYVWLFCHYKNILKGDEYSLFNIKLIDLEQRDWIKIGQDEIVLRSKFLTTFGIREKTTGVSDWIQEWIDLWPDGVRSDGISVKTDVPGITKKMTSFVKTYKKFTKDQIFEATKIYLDYKRKNNWSHIQRAHFFISKDGISNLAACVEGLINRKEAYNGGRGQSEDI